MARRRRRARGFPAASLVPPTAAVAGWGYLHEPFEGKGLLVLLSLGALAGIMMPAFLVSLNKVPMLLIPPKTRARHRARLINGTRWRDPVPRLQQNSQDIPARVHRAVMRADRYRCVWCGGGGVVKGDLHADHIRPWAGGGLTAIWNLMTLCSECNILKCNYWRDRDGYVHYRPGLNSPNLPVAAEILRCERWHRLSPARWVRAGWDLAA
jgi:5-methylcytosine-specific restriction endonuclease McrA